MFGWNLNSDLIIIEGRKTSFYSLFFFLRGSFFLTCTTGSCIWPFGPLHVQAKKDGPLPRNYYRQLVLVFDSLRCPTVPCRRLCPLPVPPSLSGETRIESHRIHGQLVEYQHERRGQRQGGEEGGQGQRQGLVGAILQGERKDPRLPRPAPLRGQGSPFLPLPFLALG